MLFESLKVLGSVAAHGFHHLFTQLHGRRQRLRVSPQDETKVDVKQFSASGEEEIVVVPIADAQNVSNDAIPKDERV